MEAKKIWLILGMVLFLICLVAGSIFNVITFWSDLEGMSFWGYPEVTSYDSTLDSDVRIKNLNCPLVISSWETSEISVAFKNNTDKNILPFIKANISSSEGNENIIRDGKSIPFSPNQTKELTWEISGQNKLDNNRVMIRIFVQQTLNSPPSRTKHCGILVWDVGNLKGVQLTTIIFLSSFFGMILGLGLWYYGSSKQMRRTNKTLKLMIWIGVILCLGLIFNILGIWIVSGVMTILSIILFISIVESHFLSKVG